MIIRRLSRVRSDSRDPSSLPDRTGNASWLLTERSWRSLIQRQEVPRAVIDPMPSLPSVAPRPLPSLSPTTAIPSLPPVLTSLTHSPSSSDEPNPTSSGPSIPLETTAVPSSNTPPPESTSFWSYPSPGSVVPILKTPLSRHHMESNTETTSASSQFTLLPTPASATFISNDFPILPSKTIPTSTELGTTDDGIDAVPGLNTLTNTDGIAPDVKRPETSTVAHNIMIGAIVGSVVMLGLVLFGVIFYLRRRMSRKLPRRAADTARTVPNVTSHFALSHIMMEQQESGMIAHGRNPFLDHSGGSMRDSTLTAASVQMQCSQLGRCSHISVSSQNSRSIRFAVSGSYRNSSHSYSSRATMSVMVIDVAHSLTVDPLADPVSPRSPVSVSTNTDYSASWRGTNLSNIINAARGIKT